MKPKVSLIILNYKGDRFLPKLFTSIKKQNYPNLETILVNNFPSNLTVPNCKIINNPSNPGFSLANNWAAKKATGKYLFFLNNDVKLGPKVVSTLVQHLENNPKTGIASCKMKNYQGTQTFHTGIGIDILGFPIAPTKKTFYIEGSALMVEKKLFLKLGGFDSNYFMFHEDVDLSWKARLLGFLPTALPKTTVYHAAGASAGGQPFDPKDQYISSYLRRYYSERNNLRTILKNYSLPTLCLLLPLFIVINLAEIFIFLLTGNFKLIYLYIKAYSWNLINLPQTLNLRQKIQKTRKVSDLAIISKMHLTSGKLISFIKVGIPKFK